MPATRIEQAVRVDLRLKACVTRCSFLLCVLGLSSGCSQKMDTKTESNPRRLTTEAAKEAIIRLVEKRGLTAEDLAAIKESPIIVANNGSICQFHNFSCNLDEATFRWTHFWEKTSGFRYHGKFVKDADGQWQAEIVDEEEYWSRPKE
jgi:hypothetical protein